MNRTTGRTVRRRQRRRHDRVPRALWGAAAAAFGAVVFMCGVWEPAVLAANAAFRDLPVRTPSRDIVRYEPSQRPEAEATERPQSPDADWNLTLVNPWNALPADFTVELTELKNGHAIDGRAYPDLQEMMDACRADGLSPLICSSYRTWDKQGSLYQKKVRDLLAQGRSREDAQTEAGRSVAAPGTSEHQLGLAVDIVAVENQNLDRSQEDTAVQRWLMEHSWEYGFILRYPNGKSDLTGIIYEPWHYRYVGRAAAREICERGVTLEEYLSEAQQ